MLLIKSQIVHTCNDPNWQIFNLRYYQIGVATGYHFPEYDCTINPADVEIETFDEYEGSSDEVEGSSDEVEGSSDEVEGSSDPYDEYYQDSNEDEDER